MIHSRLLAFLLHRANSDPPITARREFYALKDRLLDRHGVRDGEDVQHIVKECWGYWDEDGCRGPSCGRCGGSGIFEEFYVLLDRYRWGRYVFHRPAGRTWSNHPAFGAPTIEGRIVHVRYGRSSSEACLWLYVLTGEWALLWRSLRWSRMYRIRAWPLLNLQRVVFELARIPLRVRDHARRRRWEREYRALDQELPF